MLPACSKAEMLTRLAERGFPVPALTFFTVGQWLREKEACLEKINAGPGQAAFVAVRSSSITEDGAEYSQAGAFHSVLNVSSLWPGDLMAAIEEVRAALPSEEDQIIVQAMVENVGMSGVLMTRSLDDGSPYYVVNYDDVSGRTDTVTGGRGVNKTVYIHREAHSGDFDSPRLLLVLKLARTLEAFFGSEALDLEFAVTKDNQVHLLQLRGICAARHWSAEAERGVNERIAYLAAFVEQLMSARQGLFGRRTSLGLMPDWNPAEMIGVHPQPLALSLYRELITRSAWRQAREIMGYRRLPPVELMVAVAGRPYIDVRGSFNSFLPEGLSDSVCARLVDAWLDRLDSNPAFHDKVEFEIVPTVMEPGFEEIFRGRYADLLTGPEMVEYRVRLTDLTNRAMVSGGSLDQALAEVEKLKALQDSELPREREKVDSLSGFDLALRLAEALEQCRSLGTLPFAVAARHGFISETWLRAAQRLGVLSAERLEELKRSIQTVSGELTRDFHAVLAGRMSRDAFLHLYGHLRPGAYDLLSASYRQRPDLFEVQTPAAPPRSGRAPFQFTGRESRELGLILSESGLRLSAESFLAYARRAVAGREYAKFIFTRHLDHILLLTSAWGRRLGLSLEDTALLSIEDVLSSTFQPLPMEGRDFFIERLEARRRDHALGRSFKLSYLIRSPRDVFIVPQHRSEPNFIGSRRVQARVVDLDRAGGGALAGAVICIESADPGYDWIFTRDIAGLITRYGGTNSHMAIRCAEYGLPAAIGCGEILYETARRAESLLLDCAAKSITPLGSPVDFQAARSGLMDSLERPA